MHCIIRPLARESSAFGGHRPSEDGVACGSEGGLEARRRNWGSAGAIAKEAEGGPDSGPPETLFPDHATIMEMTVRAAELSLVPSAAVWEFYDL